MKTIIKILILVSLASCGYKSKDNYGDCILSNCVGDSVTINVSNKNGYMTNYVVLAYPSDCYDTVYYITYANDLGETVDDSYKLYELTFKN